MSKGKGLMILKNITGLGKLKSLIGFGLWLF